MVVLNKGKASVFLEVLRWEMREPFLTVVAEGRLGQDVGFQPMLASVLSVLPGNHLRLATAAGAPKIRFSLIKSYLQESHHQT